MWEQNMGMIILGLLFWLTKRTRILYSEGHYWTVGDQDPSIVRGPNCLEQTGVDQVDKVKIFQILLKFEYGPAGAVSCVQIARNETFIFLEKLKPALHQLQQNEGRQKGITYTYFYSR